MYIVFIEFKRFYLRMTKMPCWRGCEIWFNGGILSHSNQKKSDSRTMTLIDQVLSHKKKEFQKQLWRFIAEFYHCFRYENVAQHFLSKNVPNRWLFSSFCGAKCVNSVKNIDFHFKPNHQVSLCNCKLWKVGVN